MVCVGPGVGAEGGDGEGEAPFPADMASQKSRSSLQKWGVGRPWGCSHSGGATYQQRSLSTSCASVCWGCPALVGLICQMGTELGRTEKDNAGVGSTAAF